MATRLVNQKEKSLARTKVTTTEIHLVRTKVTMMVTTTVTS